MASPFPEVSQSLSDLEIENSNEEKQESPAKKVEGPANIEDIAEIEFPDPNTTDLSNEKDTRPQNPTKEKLVPVTDEELEDIDMQNRNVNLSSKGKDEKSDKNENGRSSDEEYVKVDIPKSEEEQVKKSKLSQEDDFSSDEELSEHEAPEDKELTWKLDMYLEKEKLAGQAEESLAGPTQKFLDLHHAVRDYTNLPNIFASCPNAQHPNQTGQLSELHSVIYEWMQLSMDFKLVQKSCSINNLNNSWLDIFFQVASNRSKKPTEPMFRAFAKFVVIYGWVLEGILDWDNIFDKLKDINTSSDLTKTLQHGWFSDRNEGAFLVTLSDCLKYMENETVVQNFLQELKSRTRPTFLLSTLFRLLQGITEPKSRKDILLDKLVFKYFTTMRGIFLACGHDYRGLGTVKIPGSDDTWARESIDTQQAITLCNALLKKFLEESERIREKYDFKTATGTGIVFSESWEVRRKYINILRRVMIASCMQVKTKFEIWGCGACYEKSILIERAIVKGIEF